MDNLKHLLKSIAILNQRIKDRQEHEDNFNLFTLMCKQNDEVHLHSRFLSILLDPRGSHKMSDSFLKLLLRRLDIDFEYDLSSLEVIPNETDTSEYKEIDILLIDRIKKAAVIIENKIGAQDSNHEEEGQLERYYRRITQEDGIPKESTSVIYLSVDRDSPPEESVSTSSKFPELKEKLLSINYGHEILDWLKLCVKESYNRPILRESINQYIKLIESMTNNTTTENDIQTLMKIVSSNDDNMQSAKLLMDNLKHFHWHSIYEFWKLLSEELCKKGYDIFQRIENEEIDNLVHGNQKTRKVYFNLGVVSPKGTKLFINADYNDDICVGVSTDILPSNRKSKAKSFFKENKDSLNLENNDNWPFFQYFTFSDGKRLCISDFNDDTTFSLISSQHRQEIVKTMLKQILATTKSFEDYIS